MHTRTGTNSFVLAALLVLVLGCSTSAASNTPPTATTGATAATTAKPSEPTPPLPPVTAVYAWHPTATDRLDARFNTPTGFTRALNQEGSFGAFLRTLPLLPEGTPVVDYRGRPLYSAGHHPSIVGVVDIDVGDRDLQQCADAVIRLHAEWRFGKGERDISYRALSGQTLAYRGYASGDRAIPEGTRISLRRAAPARNVDDHVLFRGWLDDVFNYASTMSLERDATKVNGGIAEVKSGDFFVKSGSPFGHAVLILDVAKDEKGRTALLLGQSFLPAQSFQILKPASSSTATAGAWFIVEPGDIAVDTPFWPAFLMSTLHRFG